MFTASDTSIALPLAQADADGRTQTNLFEVITQVFSRPDTLAHPQPVVDHLQHMGVLWAVLFTVVGLLCLFNGYRFYKTATVMIALACGLFLGYRLGKEIGAEYIVSGCLGLLMAVVCFPLMRYAIAVLGGVAGAFIGANVWSGLARMGLEADASSAAADNYWVGALLGLMLFGLLAFILFKMSIVVLTSVAGSTLAVLGAVALVMQIAPAETSTSIVSSLEANALVLPILVFVPAVIGFILQESQPDKAASSSK